MILKIKGMMCNHCVMHAEKALNSIEGVSDVKVSLEENQATVTADDSKIDEMKKAIADAGYEVTEVIK